MELLSHEEFRERMLGVSLPARASYKTLETIGARYFSGIPFKINGSDYVIEQMQYEKNGNIFMWKRMRRKDELSEELFEIHFAYINGSVYYNKTKP